jgi:5-methylcytosine-specific restriction endonuclease McrA
MPGADARLNTGAWRKLRRYIIDRDLGLCQVRGPRCSKFATCVDHAISRADGGPMWDERNLRASCRTCNSSAAAARTNAMRYRVGEARYVTRL